MGNLNAIGMADAVNQGWASLDQVLAWHLTSNHFPPVHESFIPTCKQALELAAADDWDTEITMPNGITKQVFEIIEGLHLYPFLDGAIAHDSDEDFQDEDTDDIDGEQHVWTEADDGFEVDDDGA